MIARLKTLTFVSTICISAFCVLASVAEPLAAQADAVFYRRWAYLKERRRALLKDLSSLTRKRSDAVAEVLADFKEQIPLLTLARAHALARDVKVDAGFLFRGGLRVFANPEVISSGDLEFIDVTMYASHAGLTGDLPAPKVYAFDLRILDATGKVVWQGKFAERKTFTKLMTYEVTQRVPVKDLADGEYRLEVDTILDGEHARKHDLPVAVTFTKLAKYKDRAGVFHRVVNGEVDEAWRETIGKLSRVDRALLIGASQIAANPFSGIPSVNPKYDVRDLLRAERMLDAAKKGESLLQGQRDYVAAAMPIAGESEGLVAVSMRLPKAGLPAADSEAFRGLAKRPLILICPRPPSFDHRGRRPTSPRATPPDFIAEDLRVVGFDAARAFQVVIVESPGRHKLDGASLGRLVSDLATVLPFDRKRVVVVGDGHGATSAVDLTLAHHGEMVRGLVLVNSGGGIATPQLLRMPKLPILAIAGCRVVGEESVKLLQSYAKYAKTTDSLTFLGVRKWPWCFAIPVAGQQIVEFAKRVTAD